MACNATLIAIDGLDGGGKRTQSEILYNRLKNKGYKVHLVSFPFYESKSSSAVKMYLDGEITKDTMELNPYICSSFYAVDRVIQYKKNLEKLMEDEDAIIILDRYISSNIIHQGGKIKDLATRKQFFRWAYDYETRLLGIPKEDITVVLDVPVWKSQELLKERYNNDESSMDIHESNVKYLNMCYDSMNSALVILNEEGYNWVKVDCVVDKEMRSKEDIADEIMGHIEYLL